MTSYPTHSTGTTSVAEVDRLDAILDRAATAALRAPSVLNTQPWAWRIHDGVLELRADRSRQLMVTDPEGRMLTVSCGAALHHALIALRAIGVGVDVALLPSPRDPDLLATVTPVRAEPGEPRDYRRFQASLRRHTDRRPFGPDPVSAERIEALAKAAASYQTWIHVIHPEQMPVFAVAAATAARAEMSDPHCRAELAAWARRGNGSGVDEGLTPAVTVRGSAHRVPLRPYVADDTGALDPGPGRDTGARYLILWGDTDGQRAWLRAGEALSAVMLTAVDLGLGTSPMTDLVEVTSTRLMLRRMLGWVGHPYVVLRVGVPVADGGPPAAPRRDHDAVVRIDQPSSDLPGNPVPGAAPNGPDPTGSERSDD